MAQRPQPWTTYTGVGSASYPKRSDNTQPSPSCVTPSEVSRLVLASQRFPLCPTLHRAVLFRGEPWVSTQCSLTSRLVAETHGDPCQTRSAASIKGKRKSISHIGRVQRRGDRTFGPYVLDCCAFTGVNMMGRSGWQSVEEMVWHQQSCGRRSRHSPAGESLGIRGSS